MPDQFLMTYFIQLLTPDVSAKTSALEKQVQSINLGSTVPGVYSVSMQKIGLIRGSPFAYWVHEEIRDVFTRLKTLEPSFAEARTGLQSLGADDIFIRAWWEVASNSLGGG